MCAARSATPSWGRTRGLPSYSLICATTVRNWTSRASRRSAKWSQAWRRSTAFIARTATCRRAVRDRIRPKSRYSEILIWRAVFRDWILSKRRRFGDILEKTLSPTRRGPGSYQYRVKLERRGPAVKHPPGFFCFLWCGHFARRAGTLPGALAWIARRQVCVLRDGRFRCVDFLQAPHADGVAQSGGDTFGGGAGAAHRGDARDTVHHRAAAD